MNGNHRYEVRGTGALACRIEQEGSRNLIDYDIARRSYEARQRLAHRQQRAQVPAHSAKREVLSHARKRDLTLADVVEQEYTPNRTMVDSVGEMLHHAKTAVANHPFSTQLRNGSLKGEFNGKMTYRQAFNTSTVCLALSALMIFLGA